MPAEWSCPDCGTSQADLRYASGKVKRCKDCQRYYNMSVNAKRERKRARTPKLEISREHFLAWVRASDRQCAYCGVTEPDLARLGVKTQIDLKVEALGIDRLDSDRDYELGNISLCCFPCNKAKGNVFSTDEMKILGGAIAEIWKKRLAP